MKATWDRHPTCHSKPWHRHPPCDPPRRPTWDRHPAGHSKPWHRHPACVPPIFAAIAALIFLIFPTPAQAADEAGLKALWDLHTNTPDAHAAVIESAQKWGAAHPTDPLVPVAQSIAAWHFLKRGNLAEAKTILESHITRREDPVSEGAVKIAQAWLTRLDRDSVVKALQVYYRKEVGYPETLDAIVAHPKIPKENHPPLFDRFGAPWSYKLTGLKGLPDFANQRYQLGSTTLGNSAELAPALEVPYATGFKATPSKTWLDRFPPMVQLDFTAGSAVAQVGKTERDHLVAFVGEKIIILAIRDYWKIFPSP